jgi:DNA mismatch repair protein MutL
VGEGHRLRCEFGIIKEVQPFPRAQGTTVSVRDLFAQLPARKRFLKSTDTEHAHLWGVVTRMALATPAVHWVLRTDRSGDLSLPTVAEPGARLAPLLGEKFEKLRGFRNGEPPWVLRGYLSPPELSFRDRNHLYLFVNGRAVRDRLLLAALANGWEGFFPKGAYPAAILFLELPTEAVDVNVHPTKAEVRFREPQRIFPWVSGAVHEAWNQLRGGLASVLELPPKPVELEYEAPIRPQAVSHPQLWAGDAPALEPHLDRVYPTRPTDSRAAELASAVRYLGSFDETYLLAEIQGNGEPELWIIDQHAAHERILYERLFLRRHVPVTQPLLPPQVVQLGLAAQSRLLPFLEEFNRAGMEVEAFGEDALLVRGLPDFLIDRDPQDLLDDLLARLEAEGKVDLDTFRKDLNAELACRSAIKKHHRLTPELALRLIQDLQTCAAPHTCPHGRPVIKKLSLGELERSFGRRT